MLDPNREPTYPTIKALGGHIVDLRRFVYADTKEWSATNPSIARDPKGNYVIAIRSSNYVITPTGALHVTTGGMIASNVWFAELDKDFKINNLRKIDVSKIPTKLERGLEDPKLFWRDGHWQFTAVMLEEHTPRARMAIAHLDKKATKVTEMQTFPGIDYRRPEKNWSTPNEINPNFDFIYGPNATVKDGILTTYMSDTPEISALRGNTNLLRLQDKTYLAVCHRMWGEERSIFNPNTFASYRGYDREYVHYFCQYSYEGKIIALSKGFHFFHRGVEFAGGLSETKEDFLISYGSQDVSSHIAFLNKETVLKSLVPIRYS